MDKHYQHNDNLSSSLDEPFSDEDNQDEYIFDDKQFAHEFSELQLQTQVKKISESITKGLNKTSGLNLIKILVSKQKQRFQYSGYSLDLAYITTNIIAMGYPAEKMEALYRNSKNDVKQFFNERHKENYKIYNLCSEKKYDKSYFDNRVEEFGFPDHNSPPFNLLFLFCDNLDQWLKQDQKHVAAIHCKAGKGRTGVMICCYLLYSKEFSKAIESLQYYAMIRTKNKKGVTIPSQIRYVHYFEFALQNNINIETYYPQKVQITKIKLNTVPNLNMFGGCEPYFAIQYSENQENKWNTLLQNLNQKIWDSKKNIKLKKYFTNEPYIEFDIEKESLIVQGDFLLIFYNNSLMGSKEKMFQAWFNTKFIDKSGIIYVDKNMLDKAYKDKSHKKYSKNFQLEIHTIEQIYK